MEQHKRMRARITEEDLRFSENVESTESLETWQEVISAAWDMTIVAVAYNDMRIPLKRVPETLETLEKTIASVKDEKTLNVIEEEIKTGIRHFSDILEGARDSRERMDRILRATWNRRVELKR
jgi:endonuclease IV